MAPKPTTPVTSFFGSFVGSAARTLGMVFVCLWMPVLQAEETARELFDGKTLEGWEGSEEHFRVEDGAIVGGKSDSPTPQNQFLVFKEEFGDFELTLEFKLLGEKTNSGIQLRSQRIPDHHEMQGYQADLGPGYWGALYDESRRNKVLQGPPEALIAEALKPGEWNTYHISCRGPRIQLWINGKKTVDYTEEDEAIPTVGHIALQIHSGPPGEAWFRNIRLRGLMSGYPGDGSDECGSPK